MTIKIFSSGERSRRQGDQIGAWWSWAVLAVVWLDERLEKSRSRGALQELTDQQLKDIGLSRADAFREYNRPFWD